MENQHLQNNKGATMRLGAYKCYLEEGTKIQEAYQNTQIYERHRHRFEFNISYKQQFEEKGMVFSGLSLDKTLTEAIELQTQIHPWFVAVQYHPEFKSSPLKPHPLFTKLVEYSIKNKK